MGVMDFALALIGLVVGGGGAWMFLLKSTKQKAKAEAMKEVQDVYQETIVDLREDKRILKEEKNEDREKYNSLETKVDELKISVQELKEELKCEKLRRLKEACVDFGCKNRIVA